ncbi:hypothetical protein [Thiomicrorhabdus sp.]|uniref:hypothetical protein n=1 Tax=Thiomicrorhabdus sp. TaxID=2039724 RepID=UPI002AA8A13A|nr:hypothetical protein [Thiomicrorhabdus sp.]
MSLEKIKITLLSHSKNLLIAAEDQNWERYSELEKDWAEMLQSAKNKYGDALNSIANELIADNQKIQKNITESQKSILSELEKSTQNTASIRSYLK